MCAAVRSRHGAERLLRDRRGEQSWAGRPTVTFALTAGSLSMSASSGSAAVITANPSQSGTFTFTVKATDGNLTSTPAYQLTVTVQGPPDQLVCDPAVNGGFLENGVCVLPGRRATR